MEEIGFDEVGEEVDRGNRADGNLGGIATLAVGDGKRNQEGGKGCKERKDVEALHVEDCLVLYFICVRSEKTGRRRESNKTVRPEREMDGLLLIVLEGVGGELRKELARVSLLQSSQLEPRAAAQIVAVEKGTTAGSEKYSVPLYLRDLRLSLKHQRSA